MDGTNQPRSPAAELRRNEIGNCIVKQYSHDPKLNGQYVNDTEGDWKNTLDISWDNNDYATIMFDGGLPYDFMSIQGDYNHMGAKHYWWARENIQAELGCRIEDKNNYTWLLVWDSEPHDEPTFV